MLLQKSNYSPTYTAVLMFTLSLLPQEKCPSLLSHHFIMPGGPYPCPSMGCSLSMAGVQVISAFSNISEVTPLCPFLENVSGASKLRRILAPDKSVLEETFLILFRTHPFQMFPLCSHKGGACN